MVAIDDHGRTVGDENDRDPAGCHAFDGYEQLKSVTFFGPVPPEPECEPAFGREIPIYVIKQHFPEYKASYIWGQYSIQEM